MPISTKAQMPGSVYKRYRFPTKYEKEPDYEYSIKLDKKQVWVNKDFMRMLQLRILPQKLFRKLLLNSYFQDKDVVDTTWDALKARDIDKRFLLIDGWFRLKYTLEDANEFKGLSKKKYNYLIYIYLDAFLEKSDPNLPAYLTSGLIQGYLVKLNWFDSIRVKWWQKKYLIQNKPFEVITITFLILGYLTDLIFRIFFDK